MRFSRLGLFFLLAIGVFTTANCGYYNRIMSRKALVDGSTAYRERKFADAEQFFRDATERDPQGLTLEGKKAQVFLARTIHSQYIGDRDNKPKAEEAIREYQKALSLDPNDQSSYKAVASLYENLQRTDDWQKWVTERSQNTSIEPQHRAEAFTSLAAKQNTCSNEISDTEATKKTVKKDGKDAFQFVKPANNEDFEKMKACVTLGNQLIDQAVALETPEVKNAKSFDVKSATDEQLKKTQDLIKAFESARSYNASLTIQAMRLAEMEGRMDDYNRLKAEADQAKAQFTELSEVNRNIQTEIEARIAAAEAAANANANANAGK